MGNSMEEGYGEVDEVVNFEPIDGSSMTRGNFNWTSYLQGCSKIRRGTGH